MTNHTGPDNQIVDEIPPGLMFIGRRIVIVHDVDDAEDSKVSRYDWLHVNLPHRFTLRAKLGDTGINLLESVAELSSGPYAIERVSYLIFLWFEQEEDAILFKLHHSDLLANIFDATRF